MKELELFTVTLKSINVLKTIAENLDNEQPLSINQKKALEDLLHQLPSMDELLLKQIPLETPLKFNFLDVKETEKQINSWITLLNSIPTLNCKETFVRVGKNRLDLARQGIVIYGEFFPTMAHKEANLSFNIFFKADGTSKFKLPTIEDVNSFPEMYFFNGGWRDAYYHIISVIKNGWPSAVFFNLKCSLIEKITQS